MRSVPAGLRDVSLDDLVSGMESGSILVIDVREPDEYAAGTIPGALSLPLSSFDPADVPLGQGDRVVFSCAAGVRSAHAVAICQSRGLDLNEHFAPGYKGWVAAGGPVERP